MKRRRTASGAEEGTITLRWATRVHFEASMRLMSRIPDFRRLSVEAQAILSYVAWRCFIGQPASLADIRKVFPWVPGSTMRLGLQRFLDEGLLISVRDPEDARKFRYNTTEWGKQLYQMPCNELFAIGMRYATQLNAYASEVDRGGGI